MSYFKKLKSKFTMLKNSFLKILFLFTLLITSYFSHLSSYEYYEELFDCPSRYAFPITCRDHFASSVGLSDSWMEADDNGIISSFEKYLDIIPQCYEPDCYHCPACGGVSFDLYRGFDDPIEGEGATDLLHNLHTKDKGGLKRDCLGFSDHCEDLSWNGGYFRRWNHKYIHFFKHFLEYCSENEGCECYWPEIDGDAANINDIIYELLKELADENVLLPDFSTYGKPSNTITITVKKRIG
jgi:hypothetical protein